jgi:hypothetical protein
MAKARVSRARKRDERTIAGEPSSTPVEESQPVVTNAEADATQLRAMIAEAAYFRAEKRGFVPGHELEDWLAAEAEITRAVAHAQCELH